MSNEINEEDNITEQDDEVIDVYSSIKSWKSNREAKVREPKQNHSKLSEKISVTTDKVLGIILVLISIGIAILMFIGGAPIIKNVTNQRFDSGSMGYEDILESDK